MKKLHEQKSIIDPEKVIKVEPKMVREDFKHPDAKKHQLVSFIKSGVRIIGYTFLFFDITMAAVILIASEAIGVLEELV
jgi:hypothetical protein